MLSKKTSRKFRVRFQRHFIIQHIDFDCAIQDLQVLGVICRESNVSVSLHFKKFSKTFPKDLQLFPSCHYAEVVTMTQSFEFSVVIANQVGLAVLVMGPSFNVSDQVSPQIDAASAIPHMLL